MNITWDQQNSQRTATVEDLSNGNDIGVISDSTVEAFDIAESVISVAGEKVAIAPSKSDHVFYGTKACLPYHCPHIVLTLHIGLHITGWARL